MADISKYLDMLEEIVTDPDALRIIEDIREFSPVNQMIRPVDTLSDEKPHDLALQVSGGGYVLRNAILTECRINRKTLDYGNSEADIHILFTGVDKL